MTVLTRGLALGWLCVAAGLATATTLLATASDRFSWVTPLADLPAVELTIGYCLCGILFAALLWLVQATMRIKADTAALTAAIVLFGIALRVALLASTPALEDDFYRYLWDGGVTASGLNPYRWAPAVAAGPEAPEALRQLALASGAIIDRVNHPEIRTIYPPVAQAWFALAYIIEPWSLLAWRSIGLVCEAVTLALILALLHACGRSGLWSTLYWWNPVVIKELTNSAHMEFTLLPLVLVALLLAVRQRYLLAIVALGIAVGTKLWPVVLLPLLARPLISQPRKMVAAVALFAVLCVLWTILPLLGGVDQTSGFVAFASHWQTNSALFQTLSAAAAAVGELFDVLPVISGITLRLLLAAIVVAVAVKVSQPTYDGPRDLLRRATIVVCVLFLLSPAQFPWYATWVFVLLPFVPLAGLITIAVTIPLYYLSFHFASIGRYDAFNAWVVWAIWLPVWAMLALDLVRGTVRQDSGPADA